MPILETRKVSYSYSAGMTALDQIDFAVERGEFVAILGPNGSGKTTLFRHLSGMLLPTSGEVCLKGQVVTRKNVREVYKSVGFLFQDPNDQLFAATVGEDVAFGVRNLGVVGPEVDQRVKQSLQLVGLAGYEGRPVHNLSFGEKRRVSLAGVLAMEPEILLLDEPTAGLDPMGASRIMRLLRRINRESNVTMLMATHDIDTVPVYAERAYILRRGQIVAAGSLPSVFAQIEVLRGSDLRLPRVAHLLEVLSQEFDQPLEELPLTIRQARKWLEKRRQEVETFGLSKNPSLKTGYTTGSCAAAATKAAAELLFAGRRTEKVDLRSPAGVILSIPIADCHLLEGQQAAIATVIKDAGDDPDVTNGAEICSTVTAGPDGEIVIDGGEGVGRVTKAGLAVAVGEAAINPVPRQMIREAIESVLPPGHGASVLISVPAGGDLAKRTLNAKLGIVGGISILGTTGIVHPMSEEAYKTSLAAQIGVSRAAGYKRLYLVPGAMAEKFVIQRLEVPADAVVQMSNFVGFMLEECAKQGVTEVILAGHIGKLVKVAAGIFQTHNRVADARLETLAAFAARQGAAQAVIERLFQANTADEAVEVLEKASLSAVFQSVARRVCERAREHIRNEMRVECILVSLRGKILASTMSEIEKVTVA